MPTYDYQCKECGHPFEVRATINQKSAGLEPECPECHSQDTRQAFRSVGMFIGQSSGGEPVPMPISGCGPLCGPGSC